MEQRDLLKTEKRIQVERSFKEGRIEKAERLFREFDTIGDRENAEKQMLILCNQPNEYGKIENEVNYWQQYARFALKYGIHSTGEYYLKKRYQVSITEESSSRSGSPLP